MPKKAQRRLAKPAPQSRKHSPLFKQQKSLIFLTIILCLSIGVGAFARWRSQGTASTSAASSPMPIPIQTPALAKEYVYGGERLIATEEAGATAPTGTDLAVWRKGNGTWYILNGTTNAQSTQQWGMNGDVPAFGDYDGDSKTDFAIFRPSDSAWYILKSTNGVLLSQTLGRERRQDCASRL